MSRDTLPYQCSECHHQSAKWIGKCPDCEQWNTFAEVATPISFGKSGNKKATRSSGAKLSSLNSISETNVDRLESGISERDRVVGGGI
ncbi:DNA repair protein RadA, partial [bacterium]|nr:DNA repair protein RadA [bacterium]